MIKNPCFNVHLTGGLKQHITHFVCLHVDTVNIRLPSQTGSSILNSKRLQVKTSSNVISARMHCDPDQPVSCTASAETLAPSAMLIFFQGVTIHSNHPV